MPKSARPTELALEIIVVDEVSRDGAAALAQAGVAWAVTFARGSTYEGA